MTSISTATSAALRVPVFRGSQPRAQLLAKPHPRLRTASPAPPADSVYITATELKEISKNMNKATNTRSEQGGHVDNSGQIHIWDRGAPYLEGDETVSIRPFKINKSNVPMPWTSRLYWHVHPRINNNLTEVAGSANPSPGDFNYDILMRDKNYQGTTLLVGGRNKEITFYYRDTIIETVSIKELNRILGVE